jgi:hypothetical protein
MHTHSHTESQGEALPIENSLIPAAFLKEPDKKGKTCGVLYKTQHLQKRSEK